MFDTLGRQILRYPSVIPARAIPPTEYAASAEPRG
jgi:hypothetical protein